ncbi:MAG TPA: DUF4132 domain-containing protein, partial [Polyangiaceae bacterium]|nr:DUF4132 domain-containing protein [Polyangiaceae bacterium]
APIRGLATVPARRPDPAALYAKIARAMEGFGPRLDAGLKRADANKEPMKRARAEFAGPLPATLDLDAQAAAFAMVGPKTAYGDESRRTAFLGLWFAKEGGAFAVRALARAEALHCHVDDKFLSLSDKAAEVQWFRQRDRDDWRALRVAAALSDDAAYAAMVQAAEACLAEGTPALRAQLAVALARPEWAEADVAAALGAGQLPDYLWPLILVAGSLDEARAQIARFQGPTGGHVWYLANAIDGVRYDLLLRYGAAAADILSDLISRAGPSGVERVRSLAEALALVVSADVATFLAKQLATKELRALAASYLQAHPALAVAPLAHAAAGKGPLAEASRAVLKPIVASTSTSASAKEAIAAAKSALTPAAAAVVAALEEATRPREEATAAELPALLNAPPWLAKVKLAAPVVVALEPLPFKESLGWKPGEADAKGAGSHWLRERPEVRDESLAKVRASSASKPSPTERSWNLCAAGIFAQIPKEDLLELLPSLDLSRFNWSYNAVAEVLVARHGLELVDFALRSAAQDSVAAVEALARVNAARVAPLMADAYGRLKKAKATAAEWLTSFPEAAAVGLIPLALGKPGRERVAAETALRFVSSRGHRATLEAAAKRYGGPAEAGVRAVLDFDPLLTFPAKLPKLPAFFAPAAFSRPLLRAAGESGRSGKSLPVAAVEHLGTMLAFTSHDDPYPGLAAVRELCEPASLAEFAWDLFQAWLVAGAPSKEAWAFLALGVFGDDDSARKLTPLVRAWPGEAAHARAVVGLDVLAKIGTDVALMHLHGIAQKLKFKGLQEKAREKIDQIAEARGLTAEELADRLVPDLGLDESGSLTLDFGERTFRVVFDETLKPLVLDESGKRLPDLPKPKQTDDAEKSKAAVETWKTLKKDAKAICAGQLLRLEIAMCGQRRWPAAVFQQFLVEHPLLVHVVRRLVWGVYDGSALRATFRVTEDSTLAGPTDDAFDLADGAEVGIVHRLDLDDAAAAAWGQVLADYELIQPFSQLAREVATPTAAERAGDKLERVVGLDVPTGKVLGLDNRGWRRGSPQDGGVVCWYEKHLPGGLVACLDLDPGIFTGMVSEAPNQKLGALTLSRGEPGWGVTDKVKLGELAPIAWSELLRDLESLRP